MTKTIIPNIEAGWDVAASKNLAYLYATFAVTYHGVAQNFTSDINTNSRTRNCIRDYRNK